MYIHLYIQCTSSFRKKYSLKISTIHHTKRQQGDQSLSCFSLKTFVILEQVFDVLSSFECCKSKTFPSYPTVRPRKTPTSSRGYLLRQKIGLCKRKLQERGTRSPTYHGKGGSKETKSKGGTEQTTQLTHAPAQPRFEDCVRNSHTPSAFRKMQKCCKVP